MDKVSRSLRHVLMLSLALNVGLISRLVYEGESWRAQQSIHSLCFEHQKNREEASMADSTENKAHVSKRTRFSTSSSSIAPVEPQADSEIIINLDHGDPTMYEKFWKQMGDKTSVVISGWQSISYFSDVTNVCWFLEPEFAKAVVRLHKLVGNAVTEDYHIVVGAGSMQLFQAALYALSPQDASEPMSVVSAAPFYSSYPLVTDFLKSGLYKWAGDANNFTEDRPYIELVTSPNNPDGHSRQAVVNRSEGILIHDFAYYWPQYTPITSAADHDIMLFTISKSTGHAGMRIAWALVKDHEVAKRMTKYIELNTIGVSKDSQLRAAKILHAVSDGYDRPEEGETFFEFGYSMMAQRWNQLRASVKQSQLFSLPKFRRGHCSFGHRSFEPQPAFAWLKCEGGIEDCESFLRGHKLLMRGGNHFGDSSKYVRISMLERDKVFDLFTERLSKIRSSSEVR